jgi:hypothetical protein
LFFEGRISLDARDDRVSYGSYMLAVILVFGAHLNVPP